MQFTRYEDSTDDEMFKFMVYCRRDTRVRWLVLKEVEVTHPDTDNPLPKPPWTDSLNLPSKRGTHRPKMHVEHFLEVAEETKNPLPKVAGERRLEFADHVRRPRDMW